MSGPAPPADWNFAQIVAVTENTLYFQAAATTIVLYDHLTTIDLEVELIWKREWSLVQALYLINRYVGEAVLVHGSSYELWLKGKAFEQACKHGTIVQMALSMIAVWAMQSIIINRVWCMYRRSRPVIIIMGCAFVAEIASSVTVAGLNSNLMNYIVPLTSTTLACIPMGFPPWFFIFWCFIAAFDTLIFGLALMEAIKHYLDARRRRAQRRAAEHRISLLSQLSASWMSPERNFFYVLIRDSILFPFLGLMTCIFNLLAWFEVLPFGTLQITLVISAMASPLLGCRLILNLRELYYQPFAEEFRTETQGKSEHLRGSSSSQFRSERTFELPVIFARAPGSNLEATTVS